MILSLRIDAFVKLGFVIEASLKGMENGKYDPKDSYNVDIAKGLSDAIAENGWFIEPFSMYALTQISQMLKREVLIDWLSVYNFDLLNNEIVKKVSIVMAGNLPLVGFHDFLSVMISGHDVQLKLSQKDSVLPRVIVDLLCAIEPQFISSIEIIENQLKGYDAVIATGSNNSGRYFEYYFKNVPAIIRGHKNSIAVILDDESDEQLETLTDDLFLYFGLGCRSVSKLYLPANFSLERLFPFFEKYKPILYNHHKYMNNYLYQKSILLVNKTPFLDNGFVMMTENSQIPSPISVIHYQNYDSVDNLLIELSNLKNGIQCIVANDCLSSDTVGFGDAQKPSLFDYADGVDVIEFLLSLKK